MSKYSVTPKHALSTNFTERTLMRSIKAKKYGRRNIMNYKFMKQPLGALIAIAILSLGAVGAYAAVNWFNGKVNVNTDNSVISIDLSSCKKMFLPGFPDNQGMSRIQFKITGQPHISESDLKEVLLNRCENDAVTDFYQNNPATKDLRLWNSKVVAIAGNSVTLEYKPLAGVLSKSFQVTADTTFYNQGKAINLADLHTGDWVIFATPQTHIPFDESDESYDPLQNVTSVLSIFVTQYDTRTAPGNGKHNFNYPPNNIMPLEMYNNLHKK